MTDKQIDKFLRRKFSGVGWVLTGYLAVLNVLAICDMIREGMRAVTDPGFMSSMDVAAASGWGYILTTLLGLVVLHAWKGGDFFRRELLSSRRPMRYGPAMAMVLMLLGAQMVNTLWVMGLESLMNAMGKSLMPMLEMTSGASGSFSMFLYASILAPIGEEILFRGYVMHTLKPYGKRFAILLSALLFGIYHGNLIQMPYAFLAGLVLGYAAMEYSLPWAVGLHMFNNLVVADLLTRLTASWPEAAVGIVNLLLFGGAAIGAVVLLVKNRPAIRAYRRENWMDRRCVRCFFTNSGILVLGALTVLSMASMFWM